MRMKYRDVYSYYEIVLTQVNFINKTHTAWYEYVS